MNCCPSPKIKDLTNGLGDMRNYYCMTCKAHEYSGRFYTRKQWDDWVNSSGDPEQFELEVGE